MMNSHAWPDAGLAAPSYSTQGLAPPSVESPTLPTKTANILHIINGEHFAGAERVQDLLALSLPDLGYRITFAALKEGVFESQRKSSGHLCTFPMRNGWDLRPALQMRRWVEDKGFDAIHSHTVRSAVIARTLAYFTGIPFIHHLHSPTLRDTESGLRNRMNAWAESVALAGADQIICVSHSLAVYAESRGTPKSKIRVVHNGVPDAGPLPKRSAPNRHWTFGVVALFRPRKGLEMMIQALAELRSEGKSVSLRAIGGFESKAYQEAVIKLAGTCNVADCIEWTGFVDNVSKELSALDALVLPSLFGEGLPMVVIEAMASGAPVIASRVEGVTEAIRHGVDGLIVEPGSASDLAATLSALMEGRWSWQSLRENAHQRHSLSFSDQAMAAGVADVYRHVFAQRGGLKER